MIKTMAEQQGNMLIIGSTDACAPPGNSEWSHGEQSPLPAHQHAVQKQDFPHLCGTPPLNTSSPNSLAKIDAKKGKKPELFWCHKVAKALQHAFFTSSSPSSMTSNNMFLTWVWKLFTLRTKSKKLQEEVEPALHALPSVRPRALE